MKRKLKNMNKFDIYDIYIFKNYNYIDRKNTKKSKNPSYL